MPKVRGYISSELLMEAAKRWPELNLLDSTSIQIDYIIKKALELADKNTKR